RNSPAREAAGITTTGWDYGQTGIVTAVEHELPHEGCAEEHFRPAGPFAILPLPGNRSSLVWTETTEAARRLLALPDAEFLAELVARFGHHRGTVSLIGPRHGYPLSLFIAERFIGPRLALLGDAAHVVHPIAGLGLNLGLRDAAALAEAVAQARYLGLDIGSDATLAQYNQWRRFDTNVTALATDGLNRLFSNDLPGIRQLRDTGLKLVNLASPLKTLFMREAAGETGHLPKLMRGDPV
ncbi:MAG: FAD-dependent monooxygenase, partial [Rhizobiales bacterium]|nr:FAD-dependent monooxygenase [Hyphomicrobiales bacterium]